METIIKYNRPKNTNNRGQNNVTIINNGSGGSSSSDIDFSNIDNYLHWKNSIGQFSLVPRESYNQAEGDNSIAIGENTQTINNGELAIGMFNKPESGETYFTIGNGTDDVNRSNLFSVGSANTVVNNHLSGKTAYFSTNIISPTVSGNNGSFTNQVMAKTFSGTNATFVNAHTSGLTANTVNVSNKLTTNQLQAVSGYIKTLLSDEITVDYLTVTKAAHFFKLIIDEIKASQGQILITPANAVIDKVESVNGNYRCYFRAKDEDKEIYNNFEVNDQIVCQTFNAATGTSYDVTNTFYWRLCIGTGTTTTDISGETVDCHYIDLSDTDKDQYSISAPSQGDNVVLLGNRTDTTRQAAIVISAYNSEFLDKGIKAPSIVQYFGINDYNLSAHRRNVISRDFNEFNGTFKTSTGDDIEELIEDVTSGITAYLHTAWANSADGSVDFTKNPSGGSYAYVGFCSNNTQSDASLVYSDYSWSYIKGADGADGTNGTDGTDGVDGISITGVTEYYLISSSSANVTTATTGWQTTFIAPTPQKKYLWNYEENHFSDGTTAKTIPVIIGNYAKDGTDGDDGNDGRGISAITEYYLVTSSSGGVTTATTGWSTTIQKMTPTKKYLWNYELITYTDNTTAKTEPVIIGVYGDKGDSGTSVTVTATSITYAVTTSSTQPNDSEFTYNSIPSLSTGDFLWCKTVVNYSNGTTTKSYSVSRIGADGTNGTNGTNGTDGVDSYLHIAYSYSSDGSSGFSTTYFNGALYIGTCTNSTQSDPQTYTSYTWARLKGDKGDSGTSVTITSSSVKYTKSDVTQFQVFTNQQCTLRPRKNVQYGYLYLKVNKQVEAGEGFHYGTSSPTTIEETCLDVYGADDEYQDGPWISVYIDFVKGWDYIDYRSIPIGVYEVLASSLDEDGVLLTSDPVVNFGTPMQPADSDFIYNDIPNLGEDDFLWSMTTVTYSDGTTTKTYGVTKNGANGNDGAKGDTGDDAEFYRLVPVIEKAIVDKNGTLGVQFSYQIAHVSGSSVTTVTANTSGYWVRVKPNNSSTYYNLSTNTTTPNYTNASFITNYHKQTSKPTYFTVYLVSGSSAVVKDQKTVSVIFDAGATLEVTDEINATVQGHSETISSHTNSIATLNANYNSITTTVQSNTNNISNLSGTVTSHTESISQLQQTSSSLTSTVSSHTQSISQLQQTSTSLTSTVQSLQNTVSQIELTKNVTVDATSLSENYCYPVVISFGGDNTSKPIRCNVTRTLIRSYGVPSYATHPDGFSIDVDWTTKASGWGTNRVNEYWSTSDDTRYISDYKSHWVTYNGIQNNPLTPIVGSIGQVIEKSEEIVYVRGGSKYDISTSYSNATITLYSGGYTWTSGDYSGSRPIISYSSLVIPVQDARTYSEIVQTATNIELNVYDELKNKTGINVSAGTITLDADNTTIVGNLNLTDTNNGLTMYDNESVPRVNIQPTNIGTYQIGRYGWYTASKTETGHSNFYLELNTVSLGVVFHSNDIAIFYANINLWATSGSYTTYPYNDPLLRTQIYCNGTLVKDFGYYGVTWESNGYYSFSTPMIYTTKSSGTYTVKFTLSSTTTVSTSYSVYGMLNANIQWDSKAQTQIFTDGMLSQSSPNNYVEVKPDRVEMRQGSLGFRLISDNNNPSVNMFRGIQTIVGFRGSTPNVSPIWLPFHNFTPTFSCGDGKRAFIYQYISNINENRYAYQISPYNDYGTMIINTPAFNASHVKTETWVMLPPLNFSGEGGSNNQLPIGYTITIINNTFGDNAANVHVVPSVSSRNTGMIIDSHRDTQYYTSLNGNQTCDTYIYVGSWTNGTKDIMYWRSIHDTQ